MLQQAIDQFQSRIVPLPPVAAGSRGSSIFDLMWISTDAM
jgi:hypothetical protein